VIQAALDGYKARIIERDDLGAKRNKDLDK
jgi:hypothetical protein